MITSFRERGVLVTGASRGLGRALFERFAQAGARVVGVARHDAELAEAARALTSRGFAAHALAADVGDARAIYPLAGAAQALAGPIEVLVNNASTLGPTPLRGLLDTECEDFASVLALNLLGPFRLGKALIGGMAVRGPGFRPRVVDGVLSGMHDPGASHYALLQAFAPRAWLDEARERAEAWGYLEHEFGDVCLLL